MGTAPSRNWTNITDQQVATDAPLDTTLMSAIQGNLIHIEEWVGRDYTAAVNHSHDGNDSKLVGVALETILLTSGTTYNVPAGAKRLDLMLVGGGGGSGDAEASTGESGGGGSGGVCHHIISGPLAASYTYQIGQGGAPGVTNGQAGQPGTDTTFSGAVGVTAGGGLGGLGDASNPILGGAGGTAVGGNLWNQPGIAGGNAGGDGAGHSYGFWLSPPAVGSAAPAELYGGGGGGRGPNQAGAGAAGAIGCILLVAS